MLTPPLPKIKEEGRRSNIKSIDSGRRRASETALDSSDRLGMQLIWRETLVSAEQQSIRPERHSGGPSNETPPAAAVHDQCVRAERHSFVPVSAHLSNFFPLLLRPTWEKHTRIRFLCKLLLPHQSAFALLFCLYILSQGHCSLYAWLIFSHITHSVGNKGVINPIMLFLPSVLGCLFLLYCRDVFHPLASDLAIGLSPTDE